MQAQRSVLWSSLFRREKWYHITCFVFNEWIVYYIFQISHIKSYGKRIILPFISFCAFFSAEYRDFFFRTSRSRINACFLKFLNCDANDEHVATFSGNQFPFTVGVVIISSSSKWREWRTARTFHTWVGSYFPNFCIMLTEYIYVCVRAHAGDRERISLYERTCVKGPSRKRTFQVVTEMQLCAMMWPR